MSRNDAPFQLRLPDGMREVIKETAATNRRSMNSEIVFHLSRIYRGEQATAGERLATQPAVAPSTTALAGGHVTTNRP